LTTARPRWWIVFLKQSGTFRANQHESQEERLMDSMDLEKGKGHHHPRPKTPRSNTKLSHQHRGHARPRGISAARSSRIMNMIDGCCLVVDSAEGPQAQTRFVLRKALEAGAKPIVVINKIDRENAKSEKSFGSSFRIIHVPSTRRMNN